MDIWEEKPRPVWVPRGYCSNTKIKEDDVQMLILQEADAWLSKLKEYYEIYIKQYRNMTDLALEQEKKLKAVRKLAKILCLDPDKYVAHLGKQILDILEVE